MHVWKVDCGCLQSNRAVGWLQLLCYEEELVLVNWLCWSLRAQCMSEFKLICLSFGSAASAEFAN
eukprot:1637137-Amphidinium_carterae.1